MTMNLLLSDMLDNLDKNNYPDRSRLPLLLEMFGPIIDSDYLNFIKTCDGAYGRLGKNSFVELWSIADILKFNPYYKSELDGGFSAGIVFFGSNGSDAGFGIRKSTGDYVEVPYLEMSEVGLNKMGNSFQEFLEYLYRS